MFNETDGRAVHGLAMNQVLDMSRAELLQCTDCFSNCALQPALYADDGSGGCRLFQATCPSCLQQHFFCDAHRGSRQSTLKAAARHVQHAKRHAAEASRLAKRSSADPPSIEDLTSHQVIDPEGDLAHDLAGDIDSDTTLTSGTNPTGSPDVTAALLEAGTFPEQAFTRQELPAITREVLLCRGVLFNTQARVDIAEYPLSLPREQEVSCFNRGLNNHDWISASMGAALGVPFTQLEDNELRGHLVMAAIAHELSREMWDLLGELAHFSAGLRNEQLALVCDGRADVERCLTTGPGSFYHLLPRPVAVRFPGSDGSLLEAAFVDPLDMMRLLSGSPYHPLPQTHVIGDRGSDGSAGHSVRGQHCAAAAGAVTEARAFSEGSTVFRVAGSWHDDVTINNYRTLKQSYSALMMNVGIVRFLIAIAPKGQLMEYAVLERIAKLLERLERGNTVYDPELGINVPTRIAMLSIQPVRRASEVPVSVAGA